MHRLLHIDQQATPSETADFLAWLFGCLRAPRGMSTVAPPCGHAAGQPRDRLVRRYLVAAGMVGPSSLAPKSYLLQLRSRYES